MKQDRRRALRYIGISLAGGALGSPIGQAMAQSGDYPSRVVRLVWPFSPGGTGDPLTRGLAEGLARIWGKPVVVDNKPGAGGMIGADAVAKAQPDGHTLLLALTSVVQSPLLYSKPLYDPLRDLTPITEVGNINQALVVHPGLAARTAQELVAYARQLGKPLPYATVGLGSSSHLQMEKMAKDFGIEVVHVPYKGESPMVTDLLGGQVQVGFVSILTASKHVATGKLRPLAVGGAMRSPLLPEVPTMIEAGSRGMERGSWFGLFAPAGTARSIIKKVATDAGRVLADPGLRERMGQSGILLKGTGPADFGAQVRRDQAYWAELIRAADIRLD